MSRKSLRVLQAEAATRKSALGGDFSFKVLVNCYGKASNPRWTATAVFMLAGGASDAFDIADDSGKIKVFQTADDAIRFGAMVSEDPKGRYSVSVESGAIYATKVPANIYTDAENKVTKLTKVRASQVEKQGALEALIGVGGAYHGWDNGNAAQQARYAETVEQIGVIESDVDAIDAEIVRLNAIVASKP